MTKGRVIVAMSGGVDSSVTASLVFEAGGDQLTCVIVDTGTMRSGEVDGTSAFMQGKLKVSGDMSIAMKLQSVMDALGG